MLLESDTRAAAQARIQRLGTFLSGMIVRNIGAFIAWGLIAALFLPHGIIPRFFAGLPAEQIAATLTPLTWYLLPLLIAYTGGSMIHGMRGALAGAVAMMGVITATSSELFIGAGRAANVGVDMALQQAAAGTGSAAGSATGSASAGLLSGSIPHPPFLAAMVAGPLAAWGLKQLDRLWEGKIRPGFEMLVNNFSLGIYSALAAVAAMFLLAPAIGTVSAAAAAAIDFLIRLNLLPLTAVLIEPAKLLFLNNAINHGLLTPLGMEQAAVDGSSILLLLAPNPGPGAGVLLAYLLFTRKLERRTAGGALLVQFVGGIHEVYFPYVLKRPLLVLAVIAGGAAGIAVEVAMGAGLRFPASPGSVISMMVAALPGNLAGVGLGIFCAAAVSFTVSAVILRFGRSADFSAAEDSGVSDLPSSPSNAA